MSLFSSNSELIPIPLEDGELYFIEKLNLHEPYELILHKLITETVWRSESINVWGKTFLQPRLIAWYGDSNKNYTYSGKTFTPLDWTRLLEDIKTAVEIACNKKFNSVLLNYYRNGLDSMGFHSDDEPELGLSPYIASLSIGATRSFIFQHKTKKNIRPLNLDLKEGNLLVMAGNTQKNWKHGIPKTSKNCGPRINLTFRTIF